MTKERSIKKESRKKAALSLKEKREAKRAKKEGKPAFAIIDKK